MVTPRRLGVAAGLAVLILAGCTDDGDGDREPSATDPDSAGPLAEFFGWEETAPEGEAQFTEAERQSHFAVEERLAECMREQGFEYQPMPFWGDAETNFTDPNQEVWDLKEEDPEAFARQYGYGITTIEYDYTEPEPDPTADDPNFAYRQSLPSDARAAYDDTLYGPCYEQANREVYGSGDDTGIEQFNEFLEEMGALYERARNDSRVVDAKQEWSACMAGAGYPGLTDLYDPQEKVTEKQVELGGGGDPATGPTPDPDVTAQAREFELAIAWADYECQQETRVEQIEREVQFGLEREFLDEHAEQAAAYRDWLDGQERAG